ncbi:arginine synthesis PII-interacting regulator PirA [Crocosphaera sp. Alani8]|uniref:arginine synthesis PII-interacting regulator PirA n=1 Tax=Crocosphaera sp. Alani8 TaxID=3038952 RepID=UPI00313DAFCD
MTNNQKHLSDVAHLHRSNILKSLEHRLQVAKTKGQSRLVQQLEAEKSYYSP